MDVLIGAPILDMSSKQLQEKYLIMDIGSDGAEEFKRKYKNSIYVYLMPPNVQRLLSQMKGRSKSRLNRNIRQIPKVKQVCDWLVINDDQDIAASEIEQIMHLVKEHGTSWGDVDIDTMKFLYSRSLHNPVNVEFLDNYYARQQELQDKEEMEECL